MQQKTFSKAIIYDDNCPLCKAYTTAFVQGGFLQNENRISFTEVNMQQFKIDWQKAKHEIPLVDLKTGEVKYGVDALAEILQQKIFFIKPILNIQLVNWFVKKLYKLISYNRKIIVASTPTASVNFDCTPDFNFFWRWMFITVCFLLNTFFIGVIFKNLGIHFSLQNWLLLCLLLCVAIVFFYKRTHKKLVTEICSHILISTLIASFLMFCLSFFRNYFHLSAGFFYAVCLVVGYVFIQQLIKRYRFIITSSVS